MKETPRPMSVEYDRRVRRLMEDRLMTREAAETVVDAAMYGLGCTEGRVRAEIEARKRET